VETVYIYVSTNLNDSTQNHQLDSLLASYGLYSTVQFPTKICNSASTAIDNIFINKHTFENYTIEACVNRLSDHDGQFVTIYNIPTQKAPHYTYIGRKIKESSLLEFQINLSYKLWDNILTNDDVNLLNPSGNFTYHQV
jgi:hypothetical protein